MTERSAKVEELRKRTQTFAVRVMRMVDQFPRKTGARVVANQLVRCATSVGANYHIVCRARSKAEFVAKMGIVLEESDECVFWLELIVEARLDACKKELRACLRKPAN